MKDIQLKLRELADQLSEDELDLMIEQNFPYIYTKAHQLLSLGPRAYAEKNYFHITLDGFSADEIEDLSFACQQIIEGRGFRKDFPIVTSIKSFYKVFQLFHFKSSKIKTHRLDSGFLDEMKLIHYVSEQESVFYNLVEKDFKTFKNK